MPVYSAIHTPNCVSGLETPCNNFTMESPSSMGEQILRVHETSACLIGWDGNSPQQLKNGISILNGSASLNGSAYCELINGQCPLDEKVDVQHVENTVLL